MRRALLLAGAVFIVMTAKGIHEIARDLDAFDEWVADLIDGCERRLRAEARMDAIDEEARGG